jgi:hypothetical protein
MIEGPPEAPGELTTIPNLEPSRLPSSKLLN